MSKSKTIYMPWQEPLEEDTVSFDEMSKRSQTLRSDIPVELDRVLIFKPENKFRVKSADTIYEVSMHFNTEGKESILRQFKNILMSENLTDIL